MTLNEIHWTLACAIDAEDLPFTVALHVDRRDSLVEVRAFTLDRVEIISVVYTLMDKDMDVYAPGPVAYIERVAKYLGRELEKELRSRGAL